MKVTELIKGMTYIWGNESISYNILVLNVFANKGEGHGVYCVDLAHSSMFYTDPKHIRESSIPKKYTIFRNDTEKRYYKVTVKI